MDDEIKQRFRKLKSYNDRIPLYNLLGSEGDYNTRILVDEFLEDLKQAEKKEDLKKRIKQTDKELRKQLWKKEQRIKMRNRIIINVKKDRKMINKIIENCLPVMKLNKRMTQDCADAILVYLIEEYSEEKKWLKYQQVKIWK